MFIKTKSILSFTIGLVILPSTLCAAITDPSDQPLDRKRGNVNYAWTIANADIAPDGYTRSAVLVNGQFHGPTITANKGDTVNVHVTNSLTDSTMRRSTSIHWHGITQHTTAYQDGAAFVTQCPIGPNSTYTYSFKVPDSGTYWYHSHFSTQYLDGLRGVIVVYDPYDPHASLYDVDNETTIITLADWWHTPSIALQLMWEISNPCQIPR
jgi:iron transport multicopper oxidase